MKPKAELRHLISEFTDYILDLLPEVQVKEESFIHEDEDANLSVYPPLSWDAERCLELQDQIGEHISDVHLETGYLILVYVYMPEQQVQQAQRELADLQKRAEIAQSKLAEAAALGLLKAESPQPELVAV